MTLIDMFLYLYVVACIYLFFRIIIFCNEQETIFVCIYICICMITLLCEVFIVRSLCVFTLL